MYPMTKKRQLDAILDFRLGIELLLWKKPYVSRLSNSTIASNQTYYSGFRLNNNLQYRVREYELRFKYEEKTK